jgi:chromosome partitioning protein
VRRLALWTGKGGTGKTTAAVNLAHALAERGRRVLLVDLDAQASATRALGIQPADGLLDALLGREPFERLATKTELSGVEVVPAGPELARAERMLAGEAGAETLLGLVVASLPRRRWDWILFDCAPGVSVVTVGALVASEEHVAPVVPGPLEVAGLGDSLDLAAAVRQRLNAKLLPSRILLSRVPRTRAARLTAEGLRAAFGAAVMRTEIPSLAAVVEATARREPVALFAPDSPAAAAFAALAGEIEEG